jgi:hypothetical protein
MLLGKEGTHMNNVRQKKKGRVGISTNVSLVSGVTLFEALAAHDARVQGCSGGDGPSSALRFLSTTLRLLSTTLGRSCMDAL